MPIQRVLGADLYYEQHGQGPPIVFAHGIGGSHLSWWQQVPYFRDRYTCLTFDHPGFGQSAQPPGERWSFVDCLGGLLDELGIEQAILIAQSMGGGTCLGYTLRHPERVAALVMSSTVIPLHLPELGDWRTESGQRRAELEARGIHPAAGETMAREQPALYFLYQQLSGPNTGFSPTNPPPGSARVPPASREDLRDYRTPTLFIAGEEDVIFPPRLLAAATAAVPGARLARFPGCGHSVYFQRAEAWNREVSAFLDEVGVSRG